MPDRLHQTLRIRDQHHIHHYKLVALSLKKIMNQSACRDHIVIPRHAPIVDFAGDMNPRTELKIANQYFVGELQQLGRMRGWVRAMVDRQAFTP